MQDFKMQYERHLDLLESHIAEYDRGREHFALEIATKVRVFVHDTTDRRGKPRSVSLLTHLGVKEQLGFVDWATPPPPPSVVFSGFGVCSLEVKLESGESTIRYAPLRDAIEATRRNPPTSFVDWWGVPVLHRPLTFTRAEFILYVANKEGAHVDATLDDKYVSLTRGNALGLATHEGVPPERDLAFASVRHIAEELVATLIAGIEWDGSEAVVRKPVCPFSLSSDEAASVGRNDPCLCGSGRKQKQCFARRRPRNPVVTSDTGRLWVPTSRPEPDPAPHAPPPVDALNPYSNVSVSVQVPWPRPDQ